MLPNCALSCHQCDGGGGDGAGGLTIGGGEGQHFYKKV